MVLRGRSRGGAASRAPSFPGIPGGVVARAASDPGRHGLLAGGGHSLRVVHPVADGGDLLRRAIAGAAPYVTAGQEVNEDTVVCIIEAMKVMNEIKAK